MISAAERQALLAEALRIGDALVARTRDGVCWSSSHRERADTEGRLPWHEAVDLYSGAAGIALFLMELHRLERSCGIGSGSRHRDTALTALRWAASYQSAAQEREDGFYIGTLGICYALARAWQLDGRTDSSLADSALSLAHAARWPERCDVLDGLAGSLLGYLLLHDILEEPWLLERAFEAAEMLLERAHPGPRGLYWGRLPWSIRGLCGMSHGASGVGLAFLELGRYTGDTFWYSAAEAAFAYESCHFVPERANWLDFRKGVWSEESYQQQRGAYLAGDASFFLTPLDFNSWCNGAAGIGLTRFRGWEILGHRELLAEADAALGRTRRDLLQHGRWDSATLCHGGGGAGELLIESARLTGRTDDLAEAAAFASQIVAVRQKEGSHCTGGGFDEADDPSLFLGDAGVGYFLLRLIDPFGTPSILSPRPSASLPVPAPRNPRPFRDIFIPALSKLFARTLEGLGKLVPAELAARLTGGPDRQFWNESLAEEFSHFVEEILPDLPPTERERLADVWRLEATAARMEEEVRSFSLLHMKNLALRERAEILLAGTYVDVPLFVDSAATMMATRWRWSPAAEGLWAENLRREPGAWCTLLVQRTEGVAEVLLPPFAEATFTAFRRPRWCAEVLAELASSMALTLDAEREALERAFLHQVREMIAAGFLCDQAWEG